jgi:hypothetical protein
LTEITGVPLPVTRGFYLPLFTNVPIKSGMKLCQIKQPNVLKMYFHWVYVTTHKIQAKVLHRLIQRSPFALLCIESDKGWLADTLEECMKAYSTFAIT